MQPSQHHRSSSGCSSNARSSCPLEFVEAPSLSQDHQAARQCVRKDWAVHAELPSPSFGKAWSRTQGVFCCSEHVMAALHAANASVTIRAIKRTPGNAFPLLFKGDQPPCQANSKGRVLGGGGGSLTPHFPVPLQPIFSCPPFPPFPPIFMGFNGDVGVATVTACTSPCTSLTLICSIILAILWAPGNGFGARHYGSHSQSFQALPPLPAPLPPPPPPKTKLSSGYHHWQVAAAPHPKSEYPLSGLWEGFTCHAP